MVQCASNVAIKPDIPEVGKWMGVGGGRGSGIKETILISGNITYDMSLSRSHSYQDSGT